MQERPLLRLPRIAAAAISEATFAGFDNRTAQPGAKPLGVTQYAADKAGDDLSITTVGTAKVVAGAAFEDGDALEVGADGKAVPAAAGVTCAYAVQAARADGDVVEVHLTF